MGTKYDESGGRGGIFTRRWRNIWNDWNSQARQRERCTAKTTRTTIRLGQYNFHGMENDLMILLTPGIPYESIQAVGVVEFGVSSFPEILARRSRLSWSLCSFNNDPVTALRKTKPTVIKKTILKARTYVSIITPLISIGTISGSYIVAADSRTLVMIYRYYCPFKASTYSALGPVIR